MHHLGSTEADVTEGSGGIWERLHYDWSDHTRVVMNTTDSNVWGGRSGHIYTFTRRPDGMTDLDAVVVREGKNLKGRVLGLVLGTIGKGVLEKAFVNTVKAIEARNSRSTRKEERGTRRIRDLPALLRTTPRRLLRCRGSDGTSGQHPAAESPPDVTCPQSPEPRACSGVHRFPYSVKT